MYIHQSTLVRVPYPRYREVVYTQNNIQKLDKKKDRFYGAFKTSENGPIVILPYAVMPTDIPCIDLNRWDRAAVSIFKSSVLFLSADKHGVQLECHAVDKQITLFVEWEQLGVMKLDESHLDNFLGFIKQGVLKYHFKEMIGQTNKVRKALLKVVDSISFGLYEHYEIGDDIHIQTGLNGAWNVRRGSKTLFYDVCLEQLTTKVLSI